MEGISCHCIKSSRLFPYRTIPETSVCLHFIKATFCPIYCYVGNKFGQKELLQLHIFDAVFVRGFNSSITLSVVYRVILSDNSRLTNVGKNYS